MRKLLVGVAVLCLLVPAVAFGWNSHHMSNALVVSVDVQARSMTVKFKSFDKPTERVVTWNEKTEWKDESGGPEKSRPATAAIAKTLKSGSRVFIDAKDWVLEEVRVLAPTAKVDY